MVCRTRAWKNPHPDMCRITCSSMMGRYSRPEKLVDRGYQSTWYTEGREQWVQVDLLEKRTLLCTGYTIRQDGNTDSYMRSWMLQGLPPGGTSSSWIVIDEHRSSNALSGSPGQFTTFTVACAGNKPCRRFRIVQLPASAKEVVEGSGRPQLHLSQIELYGSLFIKV